MDGNANLVLGTAGHIDHGKSSLVLALTGTDPDRLAAEKERGITIELGFARLELPDGTGIGVVDVPGHERFVRQMIAGATGIDLAMLVIAADDGIMPQTVEHVAVLQTLGVRRCVVALTKTDLVDPEWVELMAQEVRDWLAAGPYAGADVVAVSSRTGDGLDELRSAIQRACEGVEREKRGAQVRMPVDRVFTLKGVGTVVTGTLWSGTVHVDDVLEVLPRGLQARVRSIQVHNVSHMQAHAGNRVALNLSNVGTADLHPGDFLASTGLLEVTDRFDARMTYLDTAGTGKPLRSGVRMHVAHGTREVLGRVLLADGLQQLGTNESARVQIRLEEPLPMSAGDRFVVRTYSPVNVAGGGSVLLAHPRRRTNLSDAERELLDAVEGEDRQSAVERSVCVHSAPVTAEEVSRMVGIGADEAYEYLAAAVAARRLVGMEQAGHPALYALPSRCKRMAAAIERVLIDYHSEHPKATGVPKAELAKRCAGHMEPWRFDALVNQAVEEGKAVVVGGAVGHPGSVDTAKAARAEAADRLFAHMKNCGVTPPPTQYLLADSGLDAEMARVALRMLKEDGRAVQIAPDIWFDAETLAACRRLVVKHLEQGGPGTASAIKGALGTSRKYVVPLLELFDKEGLTVREGDERRLR